MSSFRAASPWRRIVDWGPDVAALLLRLTCGVSLALAHGWGKLPIDGGFLRMVERMGLPWPALFAWGAVGAEVVGGLLLAVGLFTRWAAVSVVVTVGMALVVYHAGHPFEHRELAILYTAMAAAVALSGPGRLAIDHVLHTHWGGMIPREKPGRIDGAAE